MPVHKSLIHLNHPCGTMRCGEGWSRSRQDSLNLHDQELWLVWAGRGEMRLRDRAIALYPGVCVWMRPGGIYDAEQVDSDRLGVTFIHFDFATRSALSRVTPPEFFHLTDLAYVEAVMRRVVTLWEAHRRERSTRLAATLLTTAESLLTGLLLDLQQGAAGRLIRAGQPADRGDHLPQIDRVISKLREDVAGAPTVAAMAAEAGLSARHFSWLFRRHTGLSPQAYLLRARIERAKDLLSESDLPVQRIAAMLGYRDIYFFSRQFRAKVGQAPSAYRAGSRSRSS